MPGREGGLGVGVYEKNRPVSGALGLDRKMLAQHGLTASAFLGIDDDCLHAIMLP